MRVKQDLTFRLTRAIGIGITLILLLGTFSAVLFTVEGSTSQSAQLQTLVQVAISSRNYAISVVNVASAQGLNVASSEALLSAGNSSLARAQSYLTSNSNISGGIQLAKEAMEDFTNAATSASLSLRVTSNFAQISADLDSVTAANNTAVEFNNAILLACQVAPTNSTYTSLFQQECVSGKTLLDVAFTDLKQAYASLVAAEGQSTANLNQSEILISYAKSNISAAASVVSQLSVFTYSQRAQQYLSGPFAQLMNNANNTVTAQGNLVSSFGSEVSTFLKFSSQQSVAVDGIVAQASSISDSTSTASSDLTNVNTALQNEQTVLSNTTSTLNEFNTQILSILPSNLLLELQADISNVQSNITATNSSIGNLQSAANMFPQTTLSSTSSYLIKFSANAGIVESDNQALNSSFAILQNDLSTIISSNPLLSTVLVPWQSTLTTRGQSLTSATTSTNSSLQTASKDVSSLTTSSISFATAIQSSTSQIEVNTGQISSVSSTVSSEGTLLNTTAFAQLQQALNSIQTMAQMSTSFVSASQALLQSSTSQVGSAASSLSSQGNSLKSQSSSTVTAMNSASSYLSSDFQIRSNALTNANLDASNALRLFDDLQVSQGTSLLAQANIELQVASQTY